MPFRSEKQRRYLWANEPEIARRWTKEHGSRIQKDNGGIMRLPFQTGGNYLPNTAAQKIKIVPDSPSTNARTWKTNSRIEDFLRNDPFYWSGGYKLKNVKSFSDDPNIARAQRNIEKESMGYNPYSDPNIYVRNINDPNPWVGSDVTHEGIHDVISPTFASQTERGNIVQDVITDYSATLPPSKRSRINPKAMNEIVTNYISNMVHGDVESLADATEIDKDLMKALKKNIDPAIGQGYFKKYASRAHQNINAMNQERLNKKVGIASLDADEDENELVRFGDAKTWAEYNAPRRANRYWNRGDARTGPQKWIGNIGGNIMGGIRNIRQGIGNVAGNLRNLRQGYSTQAGYNAARQARINQNRVLMRSNPKSIENLKINYARMGLNENQINQKVQNFQNVTNQISNQNAGNQQTGGNYNIPTRSQNIARTSSRVGPGGNVKAYGLARGGLASIWPR